MSTACERCKKAEAVCYVTDIDANGKRLERRLCEDCARREGWTQELKPVGDPQMVAELIEHAASGAGLAGMNQVCDECGISFVEFRNYGLLGCPHDYQIFREPLARLLERAHDGATHHTGKSPRAAGQPRTSLLEVRRLRRQLEDAIAGEDYERAAALRDRIRELDQA